MRYLWTPSLPAAWSLQSDGPTRTFHGEKRESCLVRGQSSLFSLAVTGAAGAGIALPVPGLLRLRVAGSRAQRRRCRTTGMVAGSRLVSCFENLGSLDWAGRGR